MQSNIEPPTFVCLMEQQQQQKTPEHLNLRYFVQI